MRIACVFVFSLLLSSVALPQEHASESTTVEAVEVAPDPQFEQQRNHSSPDEQQLERDRIKAMNKDRQQKLKDDTDKLLQLATELKEYVNKTNENILSVEVIKKADEIDKLAKSVREKMKTYYQSPEDVPVPRGH